MNHHTIELVSTHKKTLRALGTPHTVSELMEITTSLRNRTYNAVAELLRAGLIVRLEKKLPSGKLKDKKWGNLYEISALGDSLLESADSA